MFEGIGLYLISTTACAVIWALAEEVFRAVRTAGKGPGK